MDQCIKDVCTVQQIQTFHRTLVRDLYRREVSVDYAKDLGHVEKRYFLVPLKLRKSGGEEKDILRYEVDKKMLEKVEQLSQRGYKDCQPNIIEWLKLKGLFDMPGAPAQTAILKKWMLVKEDKPNSCYHFAQLLQNLDKMSAEEFAVAIKGTPEELQCKVAHDLLWTASTRFKSIVSFRKLVHEKESPEARQAIMDSPVILLDPIKQVYGHKFTYSLAELSKNPNRKQEYRKLAKVKNNITSSQGRPIFSAFNIYKHYLKTDEWMRACQLPLVLAFFERSLQSQCLIAHLGRFIHPEFVLWATSANGVSSSKKCYETLETYGDTILKLAAVWLAYDRLERDPTATEKQIDTMKNSFVTNLFLFRIAKKLRLSEFMRTKDPDLKQWYPPFTDKAPSHEMVSCTGKNIADCVESLLGSFFLSNNLRKTLQLISDIQLVPLQQANLLSAFPDKDLTFQLGADLDAYQFTMNDSVRDIFAKYFQCHSQPGSAYFIPQNE